MIFAGATMAADALFAPPPPTPPTVFCTVHNGAGQTSIATPPPLSCLGMAKVQLTTPPLLQELLSDRLGALVVC